jgi:hypothetical protein
LFTALTTVAAVTSHKQDYFTICPKSTRNIRRWWEKGSQTVNKNKKKKKKEKWWRVVQRLKQKRVRKHTSVNEEDQAVEGGSSVTKRPQNTTRRGKLSCETARTKKIPRQKDDIRIQRGF